MTDWSRIIDFTPDEMSCRGTDCKCGPAVFHPGFIEGLQYLRTVFHQPMTVTSGARCAEYNKTVGGHPRSLHVWDEPRQPGQKGCMAVDIATPDGSYRGELFTAAWRLGFSIGWGAKRGFLHLDRRSALSMPQKSFDY